MILITILLRYEQKEFYEFPNKLAAGRFLQSRSAKEIAVINVYEVEEKLDGQIILTEYLQKHEELKKSAVAKLTDEEKAVLGL